MNSSRETDYPGATFEPNKDQPASSKPSSDPDLATQYPGATFTPRRDTLTIDPPKQESSTAGGYGGVITRGIAPVAGGALVGAGIGSVVPGVGTALGAGAGALAMGGTEAVLGIYDLLADQFGWNKSPTPKEATDKVLDHLGVSRAETSGQRVAEAVAQDVAGTAGITGGAGQLAKRLTGPVTKRVAEAVASRPAAQIGSAAVGGAAGQGAREAGADPMTAWAISLLASAGTPPVRAAALPGRPTPAAIAAHQAGYVLHPGEISPQPGALPQAAAGTAGKIKTQQLASLKNQEVTDRLAKQDLGLPPGAPLTDAVLETLADQWGSEYEAVARSIHGSGPIIAVRQGTAPQGVISPLSPPAPPIRDPQFDADIQDISKSIKAVAQRFPATTPTTQVDRVVSDLSNLTAFEPNVGLAKIKQLRHDSQMNFRSRDDPEKFALAVAQRKAADALEGLMDRQLTTTAASNPGAQNLVPRMQAARQMIAKIWDVRKALRAGHVDARRIASLQLMNRAGARQRQLTGGLKTISDTFNAFPKDMAIPLGPNEEVSVLDMFGGAMMAVATGHPGAALWPVIRPTMRHLTLSPAAQWWQARVGRATGLPPASRRMTRPWGVAGTVLTGQAGETTDQGGDLSPYLYQGYGGF